MSRRTPSQARSKKSAVEPDAVVIPAVVTAGPKLPVADFEPPAAAAELPLLDFERRPRRRPLK